MLGEDSDKLSVDVSNIIDVNKNYVSYLNFKTVNVQYVGNMSDVKHDRSIANKNCPDENISNCPEESTIGQSIDNMEDSTTFGQKVIKFCQAENISICPEESSNNQFIDNMKDIRCYENKVTGLCQPETISICLENSAIDQSIDNTEYATPYRSKVIELCRAENNSKIYEKRMKSKELESGEGIGNMPLTFQMDEYTTKPLKLVDVRIQSTTNDDNFNLRENCGKLSVLPGGYESFNHGEDCEKFSIITLNDKICESENSTPILDFKNNLVKSIRSMGDVKLDTSTANENRPKENISKLEEYEIKNEELKTDEKIDNGLLSLKMNEYNPSSVELVDDEIQEVADDNLNPKEDYDKFFKVDVNDMITVNKINLSVLNLKNANILSIEIPEKRDTRSKLDTRADKQIHKEKRVHEIDETGTKIKKMRSGEIIGNTPESFQIKANKILDEKSQTELVSKYYKNSKSTTNKKMHDEVLSFEKCKNRNSDELLKEENGLCLNVIESYNEDVEKKKIMTCSFRLNQNDKNSVEGMRYALNQIANQNEIQVSEREEQIADVTPVFQINKTRPISNAKKNENFAENQSIISAESSRFQISKSVINAVENAIIKDGLNSNFNEGNVTHLESDGNSVDVQNFQTSSNMNLFENLENENALNLNTAGETIGGIINENLILTGISSKVNPPDLMNLRKISHNQSSTNLQNNEKNKDLVPATKYCFEKMKKVGKIGKNNETLKCLNSTNIDASISSDTPVTRTERSTGHIAQPAPNAKCLNSKSLVTFEQTDADSCEMKKFFEALKSRYLDIKNIIKNVKGTTSLIKGSEDFVELEKGSKDFIELEKRSKDFTELIKNVSRYLRPLSPKKTKCFEQGIPNGCSTESLPAIDDNISQKEKCSLDAKDKNIDSSKGKSKRIDCKRQSCANLKTNKREAYSRYSSRRSFRSTREKHPNFRETHEDRPESRKKRNDSRRMSQYDRTQDAFNASKTGNYRHCESINHKRPSFSKLERQRTTWVKSNRTKYTRNLSDEDNHSKTESSRRKFSETRKIFPRRQNANKTYSVSVKEQKRAGSLLRRQIHSITKHVTQQYKTEVKTRCKFDNSKRNTFDSGVMKGISSSERVTLYEKLYGLIETIEDMEVFISFLKKRREGQIGRRTFEENVRLPQKNIHQKEQQISDKKCKKSNHKEIDKYSGHKLNKTTYDQEFKSNKTANDHLRNPKPVDPKLKDSVKENHYHQPEKRGKKAQVLDKYVGEKIPEILPKSVQEKNHRRNAVCDSNQPRTSKPSLKYGTEVSENHISKSELLKNQVLGREGPKNQVRCCKVPKNQIPRSEIPESMFCPITIPGNKPGTKLATRVSPSYSDKHLSQLGNFKAKTIKPSIKDKTEQSSGNSINKNDGTASAFDSNLSMKLKGTKVLEKTSELVTENNRFRKATAKNLNNSSKSETLEELENFLEELKARKTERIKAGEVCSIRTSETKEHNLEQIKRRKALLMAALATPGKEAKFREDLKMSKSRKTNYYLHKGEYNRTLRKIIDETKAVNAERS